jgi:antitoxin ParD1/3/4
MPDIHKVSIALTGDQVAALKKAVDSGDYATTSEAIREAVRDWQLKRDLTQADVKRLRKLWDEGMASALAGRVDFGAVRREVKRRLAKERKTTGRGR